MRVSELSRASGVPVHTIKYYVREGLLPAGRSTAANQADYDESHLHRLRLVRVLIDVGGLGINDVRAVLRAVGDESLSVHDMLGVAHEALGPHPDTRSVADDVVEARRETAAFVASLGWQVKPETPASLNLADALVALRRLGWEADPSVFVPYAEVAERLAARELATMPHEAPRSDLVERAVIGTVVFEAALAALRRLAQAHHSAVRFGRVGGAGRRTRRGAGKSHVRS